MNQIAGCFSPLPQTRNQAANEQEGGARGDMLNCGMEKCWSPEGMSTILRVSGEASVKSLSVGMAVESDKLLKICLADLVWDWITALGRGFGFPELDDIPVCHGRRMPSEAKLTVRITRRKMVVFLLL